MDASFTTIDGAKFVSNPALLVAPALFLSLPCIVCTFFPSPLPVAVMLALTVGPRLLWRTSQPAEGAAFFIANCIYWNLVYPAFFGSPLLIGICCYQRPRISLPIFLVWLIYTRLLSRPDLRFGAAWRFFAERDWGIIALRRFLRLRLHLSNGLRKFDPSKPVVIGIHPHGVASDYRVAMDGLLYEALPGRTVLTLSASILFKLPLVRELCLWTRCIDASKPVASRALKHGKSLLVSRTDATTGPTQTQTPTRSDLGPDPDPDPDLCPDAHA